MKTRVDVGSILVAICPRSTFANNLQITVIELIAETRIFGIRESKIYHFAVSTTRCARHYVRTETTNFALSPSIFRYLRLTGSRDTHRVYPSQRFNYQTVIMRHEHYGPRTASFASRNRNVESADNSKESRPFSLSAPLPLLSLSRVFDRSLRRSLATFS